MTPAQWEQLFEYIQALLAASEDEEVVSALLPAAQLQDNASSEIKQRRESIQWLLDNFDCDELAQMFSQLSDDCFADTKTRNTDPILESLKDLDLLEDMDTLGSEIDLSDWLETLRKLAASMDDTIQTVKKLVITASYLSRADRGCDLYVTEDGENFTTLTTNGFGDPFNHGVRVFAETDSGLGFGTANPFYGTQWWYMDDLASFDYDFTALKDNWSGEGWEWDNASKTLTLSGANISHGIQLPDGATLVVNGENTITGGTEDENSYGILNEGALTIYANNGTLYVSGAAQALNQAPTNQSSLSVSGSSTLDGELTKQSSPDYSALKQVQITKRSSSGGGSSGSSSSFTPTSDVTMPTTPTQDNFTDVSADSYYHDAVLWAVDSGITAGTTGTTFSPNADCTRAQIVTFIWRALAE